MTSDSEEFHVSSLFTRALLISNSKQERIFEFLARALRNRERDEKLWYNGIISASPVGNLEF
jgi:hypothetical protein